LQSFQISASADRFLQVRLVELSEVFALCRSFLWVATLRMVVMPGSRKYTRSGFPPLDTQTQIKTNKQLGICKCTEQHAVLSFKHDNRPPSFPLTDRQHAASELGITRNEGSPEKKEEKIVIGRNDK